MLLAKIKEKLFNRRNKVEIEDVEVKGEIPASIKALIESLGGTSLKIGSYIFNVEIDKLEWVEEIPEDYSGIEYYFGDDEFEINFYEDGIIVSGSSISSLSVGTPKLYAYEIDFSFLTHSFNELDPTLKQIVEDAVSDSGNDGVACTEAQWNAIKSLLDKSFYISYNGYNMIKTMTNGINTYAFGGGVNLMGATLEFNYDNSASLLFARYVEV